MTLTDRNSDADWNAEIQMLVVTLLVVCLWLLSVADHDSWGSQ